MGNDRREIAASAEQAGRAASPVRTAAIAWLIVYLLASATIDVLYTSSFDARLVGLHVVLVALFAFSLRARRRAMKVVGDLGPLIAAPLLYLELGRIIAEIGMPYYDVLVQRWELALFGTQPSQVLASVLPNVVVSEVLHAGYLAYYLAIFIPPLWLYAARDRRGFHTTVLAVVVTCTVCWALYVAFPVQGPRFLWAGPANVPNGPFRELAMRILAEGSSRGAAFPSSHMAVMIAETVMAWRWHHRGVGWLMSVLSVLVGVGAVYGGFHYGIDMVTGAILGLLIASGVLLWSPPSAGRPATAHSPRARDRAARMAS